MAVIVAVIVLSLAVTGVAYALFGGSQTVKATGKTEKFSMTVSSPVDTDPAAGFYPSFTKQYKATITNNNPYPITITNVAVDNIKWFSGTTAYTGGNYIGSPLHNRIHYCR